MSSTEQRLKAMVEQVARALPGELLERMAFVGGSTTVLLVDDPVTRANLRYTEDVDLIVHTEGRGDWYRLQETLKHHGFRTCLEDDVICRMRLGDTIVDFMPDDNSILGFTNRWYARAVETAQPHALGHGIEIRLLQPPYFVATKLEAFHGRGKDDCLTSHDLEDILTLVDGRETIAHEVDQAAADVRAYIIAEFVTLIERPDFQYALEGNITDSARADLVWDRWQAIAQLI